LVGHAPDFAKTAMKRPSRMLERRSTFEDDMLSFFVGYDVMG
jgi:hypothetical protein